MDVYPFMTAQFIVQEITTSSGIGTSNYPIKYFRMVNTRDNYIGEWKKDPTRVEIETLNSRTDGFVSSQHINIVGKGTKTLSISNLSRVIILSSSVDLYKQGVIFISTSSTGTIMKSTLGNFNDLAMTDSGNTLTFTNATGSDCDLLCLVVKGSIS